MIAQQSGDKRRIRSYVLRSGRTTEGQRLAMQEHWPKLGLHLADGELDTRRVFAREAPTVFEIGFGMGDSLLQMAAQQANVNFIGVEVHRPGVGRLLMQCAEQGITNLRVYHDDAIEVLQHCIKDGSLAGVQLYFPDPWHKQKHQKRRIVQPEFVQRIAQKLQPGGYLHMATDWEHYARYILRVMAEEASFTNSAGPGNYAPRPPWRPETKFERRGEGLGHGVWDLLFERVCSDPQK